MSYLKWLTKRMGIAKEEQGQSAGETSAVAAPAPEAAGPVAVVPAAPAEAAAPVAAPVAATPSAALEQPAAVEASASAPSAPAAAPVAEAPVAAAAIETGSTAGTPALAPLQAEAPSAAQIAAPVVALPAAEAPAAVDAARVATTAPAGHPQEPGIDAEAAERIAGLAKSPELAIRLIKDQCAEPEALHRALAALCEKYDALVKDQDEAMTRLAQVAADGEATPVSANADDTNLNALAIPENATAQERFAARLRATQRKARK